MMAPRGQPVLPDAVVVGPMKSGTTWLHGYLAARDDVCLPLGVKETFFFDRHWGKSMAWYGRHFRHYRPLRHRRVVEVGASYFHEPEAPSRIVSKLGPVDIVVLARNPIDRAWSHYRHLLRMGYTRLPLAEALEAFPEILAASRYREGLARWTDVFPPERVRLLHFERIRAQPEMFLADVCNALMLPPKTLDHTRFERNEAGVPRSQMVANAARACADSLRARQLYFLVNGAKRLKMKRLVFGTPAGSKVAISAADEMLLRRHLEQEMAAFHAPGR